jgi:glycosyltransferase involved in cell wall biosynthesis
LLTSDFEGLPLALLEAMSCGCIPVVSNVGGIKQLSLEGIGYKFDDFDARQIAEIIVGYFLQPEKLKAESEKARNLIVQKFSLHSQLSQLLQLYETKF